jgi:membrane protease YdiL (CAAX protease family)
MGVRLLFMASAYKILAMAVGSKSFPQHTASQTSVPLSTFSGAVWHDFAGVTAGWQAGVGYLIVLVTLWTESPHHRTLWMGAVSAFLLIFTLGSGYSKRELGLEAPSWSGAWRIFVIGLGAAAAIAATAKLLGHSIPANLNWPSPRDARQYAIWAMVQQFMLQSFFYVRLEAVLGSKPAVPATALLFASAHLPNPILTVSTLLGGLFFCEMFRRYRSIYPLGIVHAALGLSLAATLPDSLIHHLRVGIGYLQFHAH